MIKSESNNDRRLMPLPDVGLLLMGSPVLFTSPSNTSTNKSKCSLNKSMMEGVAGSSTCLRPRGNGASFIGTSKSNKPSTSELSSYTKS